MKYNILYLDFARKTFRIGGGQVYLMNLLKGLDRTSFQPYIYSLSDGSIFQELPDVYVIPHGQPFDVLDQIDAKHLRSLLSPHKFYQFFLWLIYEIRHMRRIVQREDIDLIHINGILPLIVACFSGMTRRIPSVYHVHHVAGSRFVRWGVDFLCGTVNKVFCVSEYAKKETLYFHRKKGIVLYNGIEQGTAPCEKAKTIVFVGSMIRLKGYPEFITAIAEIQVLLRTEGYRIVCCGDGIDRPLIEQAIAVHGIGDIVQLKGFQKHVRDIMRRSRIVVNASIEPEGFGLTIIEGMEAGCIVIASCLGAPDEIIEDGKNGYLVDPRKPHALAARIAEAVRHYDECAPLRQAARATVLERFDVMKNTRCVETVYKKLLLQRQVLR